MPPPQPADRPMLIRAIERTLPAAAALINRIDFNCLCDISDQFKSLLRRIRQRPSTLTDFYLTAPIFETGALTWCVGPLDLIRTTGDRIIFVQVFGLIAVFLPNTEAKAQKEPYKHKKETMSNSHSDSSIMDSARSIRSNLPSRSSVRLLPYPLPIPEAGNSAYTRLKVHFHG